jgi:hypothetical protein
VVTAVLAKPLLTFFGCGGTALMAVTVVALLWSSFGRTGSGRVSRVPFEYDGARLYER